MDTWNKYKNKKFKDDLSRINISEAICYGNFLIGKIAWHVVRHKRAQRYINDLFKVASLILQATCKQQNYTDDKYKEILTYIDTTTRNIAANQSSREEIALLLGNLSEYSGVVYTFIERIAFVRFIASEI